MVRVVALIILQFCFAFCVFSQTRKHYTVNSDDDCQSIDFTLKSPSGSCHIQSSKSKSPINLYGKHDEKIYKPELYSESKGEVKFVELNLQNHEASALSRTMAVFNNNEEENDWKVYLSEDKKFSLNLYYWVGKANVDLSNMAVNQFRISSGSADVKVGYNNKSAANKVDMDTLYAKVDMGSMSFSDLNLSKAKNIIADVGFGNLYLDFGNSHPKVASKVNASVGAGTMEIILPQKKVPVIIYLNGSPLCHVKLQNGYRKLEKNIYVNSYYDPAAKDLMTFNLDVSLGNIVFK